MSDISSAKGKSKRFLKALLIIMFSLFLIIIIVVLLTKMYLSRFNDNDMVKLPSATQMLVNDVTPEPNIIDLPIIKESDIKFQTNIPVETDTINNFNLLEEEKDIKLYLVLGLDSRSDSLQSSRSDVIMLISVNWHTGNIRLISILRDSLVAIPGIGVNRINAAFSLGGLDKMLVTLEQNFHIVPDNVVIINFQGVINVIDLIGGVEIGLTSKEVAFMRDSSIVSAGETLLNGGQALTYSRIRKADSDFGRTQRQRNVILSILNHKNDLSWREIISILDVMPDYMYVDLSNFEIIKLLRNMMKLEISNVEQIYIPADGTYRFASYKGMSIIDMNFEKNIKIIQEFLYDNE